MGTFTAQILVGQGHPNDGGIIGITHQLYLSENSIPAWSIESVEVRGLKDGPKLRPKIWVPTMEHMMEDALLMIGLYVNEDPELLELVLPLGITGRDSVDLYQDIPEELLTRMRERVKKMPYPYKLALTVFNGSSIARQILVLESYPMDIYRSVYACVCS